MNVFSYNAKRIKQKPYQGPKTKKAIFVCKIEIQTVPKKNGDNYIKNSNND